MGEPLGSVTVPEQTECPGVGSVAAEVGVQLASFVGRDGDSGSETEWTAERSGRPSEEHRRGNLDGSDVAWMLPIKAGRGRAVAEALTSEGGPRRPIAVPCDRRGFVPDERTGVEQAPDEVDVLAHSHRFVEATGVSEDGAANGQHRRRQIRDRTSGPNDGCVGAEIKR